VGRTVEFSCRERTARDHVEKGMISREAVSWNELFGGDR
jgi:hypothetical protein